MNKYSFVMLTLLTTVDANSVEYNSNIICKNGVCEKKETFRGLKGSDLKIEDLTVGQCLYDDIAKTTFRIEYIDINLKKLILISEIKSEGEIITLHRNTIYSDTKKFNVNLKKLPCAEADGRMINDEKKFSNCLEHNGRKTFRLFCKDERRKNF